VCVKCKPSPLTDSVGLVALVRTYRLKERLLLLPSKSINCHLLPLNFRSHRQKGVDRLETCVRFGTSCQRSLDVRECHEKDKATSHVASAATKVQLSAIALANRVCVNKTRMRGRNLEYVHLRLSLSLSLSNVCLFVYLDCRSHHRFRLVV
jgi:hypothetical protein